MPEGRLFLEKSIARIHEEYRSGAISPLESARASIAAFEESEDKYRAWVSFDRELLLKYAAQAKERIAVGEALRPLEGIPVGVKDVINTQDFPTQMGSPLWKGFTPGNDARVVFHLKQAGAMIAGKTVTAEFAVHALESDKTLNPHDVSRTPGTSSSGSAVAVALGMVPVALGTQTAGSIVRPASFCGVYGCKPSFGLIPRTGSLKTTDSLDTIGYFVSRCADLERVFEVLRVHGPDYPYSYEAFNDPLRRDKPVDRPWRVALVRTHTWEHAYPYAKASLVEFTAKLASAAGVEISEVDLSGELSRAHELHDTIYNKTLSYYFKEEYKKSELISAVMNEMIRKGNEISNEDYFEAVEAQAKMAAFMDDFMLKYDVIFCLSTAGEAPLRQETERPDPALIWTLTHLPVVSAPVCVSPQGLPFGIQFASRRYNDLLLFKFIRILNECRLIPDGANPVLSRLEAVKMKNGALK